MTASQYKSILFSYLLLQIFTHISIKTKNYKVFFISSFPLITQAFSVNYFFGLTNDKRFRTHARLFPHLSLPSSHTHFTFSKRLRTVKFIPKTNIQYVKVNFYLSFTYVQYALLTEFPSLWKHAICLDFLSYFKFLLTRGLQNDSDTELLNTNKVKKGKTLKKPLKLAVKTVQESKIQFQIRHITKYIAKLTRLTWFYVDVRVNACVRVGVCCFRFVPNQRFLQAIFISKNATYHD